MQTELISLALFQLFISIVIGVVILYITYRIVHWTVSRKYDLNEHNTAFAIFAGSIMFSVGYIVSSSIQPLLSTFRTLSSTTDSTGALIGSMAGYMMGFILISTVIALMTNLIGASLFTLLTTKVKELEEISKNNIAVAIITGVIILVITLFVKDAVVFLLESIVPYPHIPEPH